MMNKLLAAVLILITTLAFIPAGNTVDLMAEDELLILSPAEEPFTDVENNDWFYGSVVFVYLDGLMKGTSDTSFSPDLYVTRAMAAAIIYRIDGEPELQSDGMLPSDVPADSWYASAVEWTVQNDIMGSYESGEFRVNDSVTREQLADIFYRYAIFKGYDVSIGEDTNILSYIDAFDITEYAIPAIQWAAGESIIRGYNGYIYPQRNTTRAELAAIAQRFLQAETIIYSNAIYGFDFILPKSWTNYSIVTDIWEGVALTGAEAGNVTETGVTVIIRHPDWTHAVPRQDIPVMIFTIAEWEAVQNEELSVSAAPIAPSELGRNSAYVFALPARYNYAFPEGYEEVERIIAGDPLKPTENIMFTAQ